MSFGASVVLAGLGASALGRQVSGPHRLLAAVPLIFAAQRTAEGFVWLTIGGDAHGLMHQTAVSAFLGIAYVGPAFTPLAHDYAGGDALQNAILLTVYLTPTLGLFLVSTTRLVRPSAPVSSWGWP